MTLQLQLRPHLLFKLKRLHDNPATLCTVASVISGKTVAKSNTLCLRLENINPRHLAINQLITSIALMGTAQSHVLNADGEMMQRVLGVPPIKFTPTIKDILEVNKSITGVVNAVGKSQINLNNLLIDALSRSKTTTR